MKRIMLMSLLALFAFSSACYGAANNWGNTDTNALLSKVVPNYLQSLGTVVEGGASQMASGSKAVPVGVVIAKKYIGSAGNADGTLANGQKGQILKVICTTRDASGTFICTPTTKTGFTSFTLSAVGHFVVLLYVDDTIGWIIIGYYGATITQ